MILGYLRVRIELWDDADLRYDYVRVIIIRVMGSRFVVSCYEKRQGTP